MKRESSDVNATGSARKRSKGDASKFKEDQAEVSGFAYAYLKSQNRNLWTAYEKSKRDLREMKDRCDAMEARWVAQLALGGRADGGEALEAERAVSSRLRKQVERLIQTTEVDRLELELRPPTERRFEIKGDSHKEESVGTARTTIERDEKELERTKDALAASIATNATLFARCALAEAGDSGHQTKDIETSRALCLLKSVTAERDQTRAEVAFVQEKLKDNAQAAQKDWKVRIEDLSQELKKQDDTMLSAPESWQCAAEAERRAWTQLVDDLQDQVKRSAQLEKIIKAPTESTPPPPDHQNLSQLQIINDSLAEEVDATATALEALRSNHTKLLKATAAILEQYRHAATASEARSVQCRLLEEKLARFDFVADGLKKIVADKEAFVQNAHAELDRLRSSLAETTLQRDQERAAREHSTAETLVLKQKLDHTQAQFAVTLADLNFRLTAANTDTEARLAKLKLQLTAAKANEHSSPSATPDQRDQAQLAIIKDLRAKLTCLVCSDREKTTVLTRCFHVFCSECIQQTISNRSRKCPACSKPFGANDVHELFLVN